MSCVLATALLAQGIQLECTRADCCEFPSVSSFPKNPPTPESPPSGRPEDGRISQETTERRRHSHSSAPQEDTDPTACEKEEKSCCASDDHDHSHGSSGGHSPAEEGCHGHPHDHSHHHHHHSHDHSHGSNGASEGDEDGCCASERSVFERIILRFKGLTCEGCALGVSDFLLQFFSRQQGGTGGGGGLQTARADPHRQNFTLVYESPPLDREKLRRALAVIGFGHLMDTVLRSPKLSPSRESKHFSRGGGDGGDGFLALPILPDSSPATTAEDGGTEDDATTELEEENEGRTQHTMSIVGMDCSSCANKIERMMFSLGAVDCAVNMLFETLTVVLEPVPEGQKTGKTEVAGGGHHPTVDFLRQELKSLGYETELQQSYRLGKRGEYLNLDGTPLSVGGSGGRAQEGGIGRMFEDLQAQRENMETTRNRSLRQRWIAFLWSLVLALPLVFIATVFDYIEDTKAPMRKPLGKTRLSIGGLIMWLVSSVALFWLGRPFFLRAWKALVQQRTTDSNTLISLGTGAAYLYGVVDSISRLGTENDGSGEVDLGATVFFETVTTLLCFVILGHLLETLAKGKMSSAITKLMKLQATTAVVVEMEFPEMVLKQQHHHHHHEDESHGHSHSHGGSEREIPGDRPASPRLALLKALDPKSVKIGPPKVIPISELLPGQIVKVVRGQSLPADGVVIFGEGWVNQSMLTGESFPIKRKIGDEVIGGTILEEGNIFMRVEKSGSNTFLASIVRMTTEASNAKAPIQSFADLLSSRFVPTVLFISLMTFSVWFGLSASGSLPADEDGEPYEQGKSSFYFAFIFGVTVLVIACPCGLGLATPTAVMVGMGKSAQLGMLVKGGLALETACKVNRIIFDKTGTLSTGTVTVSRVLRYDAAGRRIMDGKKKKKENAEAEEEEQEKRSNRKRKRKKDDDVEITERELAFLVGSAELGSEHVLGRALVRWAEEIVDPITAALKNAAESHRPQAMGAVIAGLPDDPFTAGGAEEEQKRNSPPTEAEDGGDEDDFNRLVEPQNFRAESGKGLRCEVDAREIVIGNLVWLEEHGITLSPDGHQDLEQIQNRGSIGVSAAVDGRVVAVFGLSDPLREDAEATVSWLQENGIEVWMCTGDSRRTARYIGAQLGIPEERIIAEALPEDKLALVKRLRRNEDTDDSDDDEQRYTAGEDAFLSLEEDGRMEYEAPPILAVDRSHSISQPPLLLDRQEDGNDSVLLSEFRSSQELSDSGEERRTRWWRRQKKKKKKKKKNVVAMVGDGINDSPALMEADLSVSLGSSSAIAMETAGVILHNDRLSTLIVALDLSRATLRRIKWNFFWALCYNVIGIPVAAGIFYPISKFTLPPELAAFSEALSSTAIILSSLLLRFYTPPKIVTEIQQAEERKKNDPSPQHQKKQQQEQRSEQDPRRQKRVPFQVDASQMRQPLLSTGRASHQNYV